MKIYNPNGTLLIDVQVSDDSYRYRKIMGENAVTLTFSLTSFIEIPVGSYLDFQAERYTLLKPIPVKKNSTRDFEYSSVVFESAKALMGRYKFRDSGSNRLKFSLTAKPSDHLAMLVWNLNQRDSGWSAGECIDAVEKVISYNHTYCDDALKTIAETFETEFEVVGKVISIKKVEYNKDNPLSLSYGKGNGFKVGVKRDNYDKSKIVEILYVQGGEKNIDKSKYGSSELVLPKSQQLTYEGRSYVSDANGLFIKRADKALSSNIEDSLDCSHIYPSRVGVISSVVVANADKNFYDFIDSSIPDALNFETCLMKGEKMTVIFQSGILAGKEFDVAYSHATRKFEIVPQEIDGVTMPNSTFKPAVGDKYAVFGISLPDAYVCDNITKTGASWDMFRESAKYLYENEDPRFSFTGDLDGVWAKKDWANIGGKIKLGGFVSYTDAQIQTTPVLIRQIGIKDFINNPHSPEIELSNVTTGGGVASDLKKLDANQVITESLNKDAIRYAKRGFRDLKETSSMLKTAFTNFTGAISPVSVQAMQYIAGDDSLQFEFVANSNSTTAVPHSETYDPATYKFTSAAGILQHKTIGISNISSSHLATEYKSWSIPVFVSAVLDNPNKSYFLYAKVSKSANTGVFLLSETAISLESVSGYYHLLMGILNSEYNGDRSYSQMYGYSELTPGRLLVRKIISPSGNTVIDVENDILKGNFTFLAGSTGLENIPEFAGLVTKTNNYKIGSRNYLQNSRTDSLTGWYLDGGTATIINDTRFGNVVQYTRPGGGGNFMKCFTIAIDQLANSELIYYCIAKEITANSGFCFGGWSETYSALSSSSSFIELSGGWRLYYAKISPMATICSSPANFGLNSVGGSWQFYSFGVAKGNIPPSDWSEAAEDAQARLDAQGVNMSNYVNSIKSDLQGQIDGTISNWFDDYEPTLLNQPAIGWTNAAKELHLGDIFYYTSKGYAYRFQKVSGLFSWGRITDSDITKALADAANAKTIARGKSTTFSNGNPYCPYFEGDLWLNNGELLTCNTDRETGVFVSSDWEKKVKYTDDTAVKNLKIGGVNYMSKNYTPSYIPIASPYASSFSQNNGDGITTKSSQLTNAGNSDAFRFNITYKNPINSSTWMSVSFWYKHTGGDILNWNVNINDINVGSIQEQSVGNEWKKFEGTAFICNYIGQYGFIDFRAMGGNWATVLISDLMIEDGNKPSASYIIADGDINSSISDAKNTAIAAQTAAQTAQDSANALKNFTDTAFRDGIISQAEAASIEKYKAQVKKDYDADFESYKILINSEYLEGTTEKTTLINSRISYSGNTDILLASINTAIADGKTTESEKNDVDYKYLLWGMSAADYSKAVEDANKVIQKKIEEKSKSIASPGRNYVPNSDFSRLTINENIGWDKTLNGNLTTVEFDSGYNPGVQNPTVGYHGHFDKAKFGFPVYAMINRNGQFGIANRWMAFVHQLNYAPVTEILVPSATITLSMDVWADTIGMYVRPGIYNYQTGNSVKEFYALISNTEACKTSEVGMWVRRKVTFVLESNYDSSKYANLYIYGMDCAIEGSQYIRNIKIEKGNGTPFCVSDEDIKRTFEETKNAAINTSLEYGNGVNLFPWSEFAGGLSDFEITSDTQLAQSGCNLSPDWSLGGNTDIRNSQGLNTIFLQHNARSKGTFADVVSKLVQGIAGGKKYIASVYSGAHRCDVRIFIFWFDSNGSFISYSGDVTGSYNTYEKNGGKNIDGYKRIFVAATSPANATSCQIIFRKYDTYNSTDGNSYGFFVRPALEQVADQTTKPGPWSPFVAIAPTQWKLSDIYSDSKLTPSEKQQIKREIDNINVKNQYINIKCPSEIDGFLDSYNDAHEFLVSYINPLLSDLNSTSDISASALENNFKNYYTAEALIEKQISEYQTAQTNSLDFIKEAMAGNATAAGALTLLSLMLAKGSDGVVRSGMSGLASDPVGFFTGGTYEQALANLAKTIFRKDGSARLADGQINWDALGKLMVGNFTIEKGSIVGKSGNKYRIKISTEAISGTPSSLSNSWVIGYSEQSSSLLFSGEFHRSEQDNNWDIVESYSDSISRSFEIPYATYIQFQSGIGQIEFSSPDNVSNFSINVLGDVYLNNTKIGSDIGEGSNFFVTGSGTVRVVFKVTIAVSMNLNTSTNWELYPASNMDVYYQTSTEQTMIGSDGFYSFFSQAEHVFFKQGLGLKVKGTTDTPGVLAAGSVSTGGIHSNG